MRGAPKACDVELAQSVVHEVMVRAARNASLSRVAMMRMMLMIILIVTGLIMMTR